MGLQNWNEKYRPQSLSDIIGQNKIIHDLQEKVNNGGNITHLLFYGLQGTGKTTTAKAIAHDLFGENWQAVFYETNASDDRGIDNVRNRIINYARHKPFLNTARFKIIFMDECDGLTIESQNALRVPMEKYQNCRFILSCNDISKIIQPIRSRCTVYHFQPIDKADVVKRLQYIAEKEGLTVDMKQLEMIADLCNSDLRKAINDLQMNKTPMSEEDRVFLNIEGGIY